MQKVKEQNNVILCIDNSGQFIIKNYDTGYVGIRSKMINAERIFSEQLAINSKGQDRESYTDTQDRENYTSE